LGHGDTDNASVYFSGGCVRASRACGLEMMDVDKFLHRRKKILVDLDVAAARAFYRLNDSDEVIYVALHKARAHSTDIDASLRIASQRWLKDRGYSDLATGRPIGDPEILPE
jgi:hypothetical protein